MPSPISASLNVLVAQMDADEWKWRRRTAKREIGRMNMREGAQVVVVVYHDVPDLERQARA